MVAIFWFLVSVFLGLAAYGNGRSFWIWFLLGMAIDPILAILIFVIVSRTKL